MDDFEKLVNNRYSCRDFDGRKIPKTTIYKILKTAVNAPSAKNSQPWSFYITNTKAENQKITKCLQDSGKNKFLDNVSAYIAVLENEPNNIKGEKYGNSHFLHYDIGAVSAYITLTAKHYGIDSCEIGWINFDLLKQTLGVNKDCSIVIALGYSKSGKTPKKNRVDYREKIENI